MAGIAPEKPANSSLTLEVEVASDPLPASRDPQGAWQKLPQNLPGRNNFFDVSRWIYTRAQWYLV